MDSRAARTGRACPADPRSRMLGVFSEFERSIIRERVNARLARARAEGTKLGRPATVSDDAALGRPSRPRASGKSFRAVARQSHVGVGTCSA